MVKAGMESGNSSGWTATEYLGESGGYRPQLDLAKYLAVLGVQKKTQADDLYGGYEHAKGSSIPISWSQPFGKDPGTGGNTEPPMPGPWSPVLPWAPPPKVGSGGGGGGDPFDDEGGGSGGGGGGGGGSGGGGGGGPFGGGSGGGGGGGGGGPRGGEGGGGGGGVRQPTGDGNMVANSGPSAEQLLSEWVAARRRV